MKHTADLPWDAEQGMIGKAGLQRVGVNPESFSHEASVAVETIAVAMIVMPSGAEVTMSPAR